MKKLLRIPYHQFRIAALIALSIFLIIEAFRQCDFNIFYTAAIDVTQHENVYTKVYQGWLHYYYSPFFAVLLIPFTYLPEYVVTLLWLVLNVYLFYRIWEILKGWLDINLLPIFTQRVFFWVTVVVSVEWIRDNLHYHQITIIMVYLGVQGLDFIWKKKEWRGGALIALGVNIKIMPIVFFPYMLYRGHWKAALSAVIVFGVLLYIPVVFIGWEYNNFLLGEWWNGINPSQKENILDFSWAGLGSLVTALFHSQKGETRPIFITQLSQETIAYITNGLRFFVAVFTLYFLRTLPFQKAKSNLHRLREVGYLFLVTPLIFPHQQNYAYFYLYPAVVYLVYIFYRKIKTVGKVQNLKRKDKILLGILGVSCLMMNSELLFGVFRTFYIDIRVMTWAAILFFLVYVVAQRHAFGEISKKQNNSNNL